MSANRLGNVLLVASNNQAGAYLASALLHTRNEGCFTGCKQELSE